MAGGLWDMGLSLIHINSFKLSHQGFMGTNCCVYSNSCRLPHTHSLTPLQYYSSLYHPLHELVPYAYTATNSVLYTVKKLFVFPVPSRVVTYQTLPGRE
jgi:hypothetical protein